MTVQYFFGAAPPPSPARQVNAPWLVTLGDLLTLLLCLFIAVISLTREEKLRVSRRLAASDGQVVVSGAVGTQLAEEQGEGLGHAPWSRPILVLTDEHVADPRSGLLREWIQGWKAQGALEIELTVCGGGEALGGEESASIHDRAAQLIMVAAEEASPQALLKVNDVGVSCGVLRSRALGIPGASEARAVARVSLVRRHG